MAHLLSSERPAIAAAPTNLFSALANWVANVRKARHQRIALESLLDYDTNLLDDLGINRADLFEALDAPSQRPGLRLAQKRAQSARHWLNQ